MALPFSPRRLFDRARKDRDSGRRMADSDKSSLSPEIITGLFASCSELGFALWGDGNLARVFAIDQSERSTVVPRCAPAQGLDSRFPGGIYSSSLSRSDAPRPPPCAMLILAHLPFNGVAFSE
jgi:hypothetical protein